MNQKEITISRQQIECELENAMLIKVDQKKSKGYHFWHPKDNLRPIDPNNWYFAVQYDEDTNFRIFKNGQGMYNKKEVINQFVVIGYEIVEYMPTINRGKL